jgi:dienelactone hydrolase
MKYILLTSLLFFSFFGFANTLLFEELTFKSHDTKLSGTLVHPKETQAKAAVIFVHGSGKQTRYLALAERFAQQGIAALVYDKRGVGESAGDFEGKNPVSERNLSLLADDAAAAFNVIAQHPKLQNIPIGMTGLSQAGWIVPLAALRTPAADFLVLWSGPVTKVSEEDILSKYTKDKDSDEVPSFAEALAARKTPYIWPAFLGKDTDPNESLEKLDIPGLWIFGGQDGSIPVDLSMANLKRLKKQNNNFEYVLFSNAGHMNIKVSLPLVTQWILSQQL